MHPQVVLRSNADRDGTMVELDHSREQNHIVVSPDLARTLATAPQLGVVFQLVIHSDFGLPASLMSSYALVLEGLGYSQWQVVFDRWRSAFAPGCQDSGY